MASITSLPSGVTGSSLVLISEQTASSSANISFTSGIDSTYKEYVFKFIDIHPATDAQAFTFNLSVDGGSNYNVTKTTTYFLAYHNEGGSSTTLGYTSSADLAQSTGEQYLFRDIGNDNDQSGSGTLHLFDPSNTTFVKHFIGNFQSYKSDDYTHQNFPAGYGNTTSAVNAIRFKFASGNIDSGTIKMYGVV
tara:strand:+ start:173 stop:748 length:576 start_codon:yes stop_codon:yes gene_type:complete